jgi:hypothetical protein
LSKRKTILSTTIAALLISGAAICAVAQSRNGAVKQNTREQATKAQTPTSTTAAPSAEDASYSYEFQKSDFFIRHIVIKHNATGRGEISFERQGDLEPIVEPFELSASAWTRIAALWEALRFLDSNADYQSEKQFPHLGTMRLGMAKGTLQRVAEFNWTNDANARALTEEYRRLANQAIFIFDITVARENQPLNSPKLLDVLDGYLKRNDLSDPQQLVPLLRELSTDERIPLMSRNHAGRILKKLEK